MFPSFKWLKTNFTTFGPPLENPLVASPGKNLSDARVCNPVVLPPTLLQNVLFCFHQPALCRQYVLALWTSDVVETVTSETETETETWLKFRDETETETLS